GPTDDIPVPILIGANALQRKKVGDRNAFAEFLRNAGDAYILGSLNRHRRVVQSGEPLLCDGEVSSLVAGRPIDAKYSVLILPVHTIKGEQLLMTSTCERHIH
ncbi:MAG: hypothetical protein AAFV19_16510, partial [Pseudomonadota bacterium]